MSADRLRSVLVVGAHPDDETVMVGGTLALLHECGVATYVLCVTDGRGGENSGVPGAETPDALAEFRRSELQCAMTALGVTGLTMLNYVDPVMGSGDELYAFEADERTLADQIAAHIVAVGAQVVLTHGTDGEYGHPAHAKVHRIALRAVREQTPQVITYGFAAQVPTIEDHLWNQSDPAHLALDIRPWFTPKYAAMLCHRTQVASFKRHRKLRLIRDAVRTVEAFHRHWPPIPAGSTPDDPFADLLRTYGAWQPEFPQS